MKKDILIKFNPRNRIHDLESYKSSLKEKLKGRVEEAYIFGSVARNEFSEKSDIDLILVVATKRPFHERILDFEDIHTGENEMDILIYTPSEFLSQKKREQEGGFWSSVAKDMIRIV